MPSLRVPIDTHTPGVEHVAKTDRIGHPLAHEEKAFMLAVTDELEAAIQFEGPETVAAVFLEPVQNAGGCFTPPEGYFARVREICDKYGVLLVSDEVICAFGRLGHTFGAERYDYLPDIVTCAKGLTSGYSPLGAVVCRDFLAEPFLEGKESFAHALTYGAHPVACADALANLDAVDREDVLRHVRANEDALVAQLRSVAELPIVGDLRGTGYFWALELVKDAATMETFTREESDELLRGFLGPRFLELGLIARIDDRVRPVVQLAPPLISGPDEFAVMTDRLHTALHEAGARFLP